MMGDPFKLRGLRVMQPRKSGVFTKAHILKCIRLLKKSTIPRDKRGNYVRAMVDMNAELGLVKRK